MILKILVKNHLLLIHIGIIFRLLKMILLFANLLTLLLSLYQLLITFFI